MRDKPSADSVTLGEARRRLSRFETELANTARGHPELAPGQLDTLVAMAGEITTGLKNPSWKSLPQSILRIAEHVHATAQSRAITFRDLVRLDKALGVAYVDLDKRFKIEDHHMDEQVKFYRLVDDNLSIGRIW